MGKKYLIHYGISNIITEIARLQKKDFSKNSKLPNFDICIQKNNYNNILHDNLVGKILICEHELYSSTHNSGNDESTDKSFVGTEIISTQIKTCQYLTPSEKKRL